MSGPLLEVRDLTTVFRSDEAQTIAVNHISFSLNKGETLGIVGESGSGKSVTALSIMRLIPDPPGKIVSGEILFGQPDRQPVNLLSLSDKEIRHYRGNRIGMIFQEPMTSLNPVYTCGDQVAEAIRQHKSVSKKEAREICLRLFDEVQLPSPERIFNSYPHQLSGGQKQRVMIAMAVSCHPSILIADEPTTALDVTVQKTILQLIKKLQKELDMSVMFISHDLGVIAEIADRILVMYKGKIVEEGKVSDIFENPQHPYTKGLLACRPPLDRKLKVLPTMRDFMREDEKGGVQAIDQSVQVFMNRVEESPEERRQHLKELYARTPILQVKNLKTWFPVRKGVFGRTTAHVRAVDEVSLTVYPGETLGLVGESGSGKTTLGRSILRLVGPSEGEVFYGDINLMELSPEKMRRLRKKMQIIFQDPYSSLNPRMIVGKAILEPMQVHGLHGNNAARKQKVLQLLDRVGLPAAAYSRYPHEFSGGQRQRISIARALAVEPDFMICDESVSALDVSVQAQVLNLLNELKRDFNLTYIFISHDLSVVKFMSDRIVVMKGGRIEEEGLAEEIYHNPKSEYTRKLIAAVPKGKI